LHCHRAPKFKEQITQHTFHKADSEGSACLNCHMPHTTYALFKAIRSHQISSPNLESSARYGTPNACNLCHLDQTLAWTRDALVARYGQKSVPLTPEQENTSAALLWLLKGHAGQRVIAAWHIGWRPAQQVSGADWLAPFTAQLLADPYGVVRYVAARSLRTLPGFNDFQFDFLANLPARAERTSSAVQIWRSRPVPAHPAKSTILLDDSGRVIESKLRDLLEQRDDRSVTVKE
jgi:hypothetical protein